jgi:hypothetical protein
MVTEELGAVWNRKHDDPGVPTVASAPSTLYPTSLEDVIDLCANRPGAGMTAAGSHWALSDAAIADNTFIETHDPARHGSNLLARINVRP